VFQPRFEQSTSWMQVCSVTVTAACLAKVQCKRCGAYVTRCLKMILCYRNHPEEVHRLIPWLNRELQAILRSPGLSARVLDLVISQLPHCHIQSSQFRFQLESYLREHNNHFIHEFYIFARSPYDMIGFDENALYSERSNFWVCVLELYMNLCFICWN
jgi:hypothetical protein